MKREEAIAGIAWAILKEMPDEQRQEILNDPDLLLEFVDCVNRLAHETHEGARLNNLTLDEYMQMMNKMQGDGGNA